MKLPNHEFWYEGFPISGNVGFALLSDLHHGLTGNTHRNIENLFKQLVVRLKGSMTCFIFAGDMISIKQENHFKLFRLFREYFPDHVQYPAVLCYGNHDFWDYDRRHQPPTYEEILAHRKEVCETFHLHDVDNGIFEAFNNVAVVGYDGWYWHLNPQTNDKTFMAREYQGKDTFVFLNTKAHNDLDRLLQLDYSKYRKKICVTHFPPFTDNIKFHEHNASHSHMEPITTNFDVLCVGHSHRKENFFENGCHVLNCGSESGRGPKGYGIRECPRAVLFTI